MTAFDSARDHARADVINAFCRVWDRLCAAGATFTGTQRIAIARVARAARSGHPLPEVDLPAAAVEAARIMGAEPAAANPTWITESIQPDLGFPGYVEIVGLVAQLTAVDTFHRAMGLPLEPLPDPLPVEPTGRIATDARLSSSWVPTAGPASVVYALSLVPGEMEGFEDLHGPLYIPVHEMGNNLFARTLQRPQMELVAARTSAINDCFY
jgi:hypothetical protein